MRLLVSVHEDGPFDFSEATHAVVDYDPEHLTKLKQSCQNVLSMNGMFGIDFHLGNADTKLLTDDELPDGFDVEDFEEPILTLSDNQQVTQNPELQVDLCTMRLTPHGVLWQFVEKHSGVRYESHVVGWDSVEEDRNKHQPA